MVSSKNQFYSDRISRFLLLICIFFIKSFAAYAGIDKHLPRTGIVEAQYKFWKEVFLETGAKDYIIHDIDNPSLILERVRDRGSSRSDTSSIEAVRLSLEAYLNALDTYRRFGKEARLYGPAEKKIWSVYAASNNNLQKLLAGEVRLRFQQGLKDDFKIALRRSRTYLPFMEKAFVSKGVPSELTRIAFVESMFNPIARSKVGAAGIWQIMPSVARSKILMTSLVDERLSPYKATPLAADHLLKSYKQLGNWPLAIMAYNHGPAGVRRAVKSTNSTDISRIIESYRSQTYGFASKNFYAEFLAVKDAYEEMSKEDLDFGPKNPLIKELRLPARLKVSDFLRITKIDRKEIERHNPCLRPQAFTANHGPSARKPYSIYLPHNLYTIAQSRMSREKL